MRSPLNLIVIFEIHTLSSASRKTISLTLALTVKLRGAIFLHSVNMYVLHSYSTLFSSFSYSLSSCIVVFLKYPLSAITIGTSFATQEITGFISSFSLCQIQFSGSLN